jgi:hypothetical protein
MVYIMLSVMNVLWGTIHVMARNLSFQYYTMPMRPHRPLLDQWKMATKDHRAIASAGNVQGYMIERE